MGGLAAMAALPTLVGTKSIGTHSTGAPLEAASSVWVWNIAGDAAISPVVMVFTRAGASRSKA